ncbi:hypothetical protein HPP92_011050 [Vanilla planifolia]|uniref:Uncharacterized protein n=1 Tax=Vanilla planifolia TaxID=51239 RepID=A0A835R6D0_VANPL|nr:hypothetical protein HPP92_011050 [Vanilla planifolia]
MWRRSASFVLDKRQQGHPSPPRLQSYLSSDVMEPNALQNPNPDSNHGVSAYYQTRAEHHAVVTSDWLAQAQAAATRDGTQTDISSRVSSGDRNRPVGAGKPFNVIDEFNYWRKKPDLAEAVAAIMALAAFIRSSEAATMMELEIELKKASDALKVTEWAMRSLRLTPPAGGEAAAAALLPSEHWSRLRWGRSTDDARAVSGEPIQWRRLESLSCPSPGWLEIVARLAPRFVWPRGISLDATFYRKLK